MDELLPLIIGKKAWEHPQQQQLLRSVDCFSDMLALPSVIATIIIRPTSKKIKLSKTTKKKKENI